KKPLSISKTDAAGSYEAALPAGDYQALVVGEGVRSEKPESFSLIKNLRKDFNILSGGRLRYVLRDKGGQKIPGKLVFFGDQDTPAPRLGRSYLAQGAANTALTHTGSGQLMLPVGKYIVYGCHGPEYDVAKMSVTIKPGSDQQIVFDLKR